MGIVGFSCQLGTKQQVVVTGEIETIPNWGFTYLAYDWMVSHYTINRVRK
jgi:hypothetical protein